MIPKMLVMHVMSCFDFTLSLSEIWTNGKFISNFQFGKTWAIPIENQYLPFWYLTKFAWIMLRKFATSELTMLKQFYMIRNCADAWSEDSTRWIHSIFCFSIKVIKKKRDRNKNINSPVYEGVIMMTHCFFKNGGSVTPYLHWMQ